MCTQPDVQPQEASAAVGDASQEGRYNMRAKTRGHHPGVEAGLAKQTKQEVAAGAKKKRDQKQAKVQEKAENEIRHAEGVQRIAAMQNRHVLEDRVAAARLEDWPESSVEGELEASLGNSSRCIRIWTFQIRDCGNSRTVTEILGDADLQPTSTPTVFQLSFR